MLRDAGDVRLEVCPRIGVPARGRDREHYGCHQEQPEFCVSGGCFHRFNDSVFSHGESQRSLPEAGSEK